MGTRGEDYIDPSRPDAIADDRQAEVVSIADDDGKQAAPAVDDKREQRAVQIDTDDEESYSKKVQRRINREIALRRRVEQRLNEQTAETMELRERLAKLERASQQSATGAQLAAHVSEIERKIQDLRAKLEVAIEHGKTTEQLDLNIQLADLVADLKLAKFKVEQSREAAEQPKPEPSREERPPGVVDDWIRANKKWWNLSRFRDAKADAITIDKEIMAEIKSGELDFELYSEEHLRELASRLKQAYPELDVRDSDGQPVNAEDELDQRVDIDDERPTPSPKRFAPVGGINRSGRRDNSERAAVAAGRVRLTNQDFATMRIFGLDPNNDEHRKRFAKERQRTVLATGARS
jgi:hypothetical protein